MEGEGPAGCEPHSEQWLGLGPVSRTPACAGLPTLGESGCLGPCPPLSFLTAHSATVRLQGTLSHPRLGTLSVPVIIFPWMCLV